MTKKKYPHALRPIFNRVLLKRELAEEKSKGGIIVNINADQAKRNAPNVGIVLDVGSSCSEQVKKIVGRKVIFSNLSGSWIKTGKDESFLCYDEDILAVIIDNVPEPLFNRALLKRDLAKEKTESGLIISLNTKRDASYTGTIVKVGADCDDPVKELLEKRVIFKSNAGDWLKSPDSEEEYFICSDEDILGEVYV